MQQLDDRKLAGAPPSSPPRHRAILHVHVSAVLLHVIGRVHSSTPASTPAGVLVTTLSPFSAALNIAFASGSTFLPPPAAFTFAASAVPHSTTRLAAATTWSTSASVWSFGSKPSSMFSRIVSASFTSSSPVASGAAAAAGVVAADGAAAIRAASDGGERVLRHPLHPGVHRLLEALLDAVLFDVLGEYVRPAISSARRAWSWSWWPLARARGVQQRAGAMGEREKLNGKVLKAAPLLRHTFLPQPNPPLLCIPIATTPQHASSARLRTHLPLLPARRSRLCITGHSTSLYILLRSTPASRPPHCCAAAWARKASNAWPPSERPSWHRARSAVSASACVCGERGRRMGASVFVCRERERESGAGRPALRAMRACHVRGCAAWRRVCVAWLAVCCVCAVPTCSSAVCSASVK